MQPIACDTPPVALAALSAMPHTLASAEQIKAACRALVAKLVTSGVSGPRVYVHISSEAYCRDSLILAVATSSTIEAARFTGSTWPKVFAQAEAWIATRPTVERDAVIRRMALAILDLTDMHGECTAQALARQDFTRAQITDLHEAACTRAGEMAGNRPFAVKGVA